MPESDPVRPSSDDISLRDLYLILRRSLVPIAIAALLAGAAAFVITSLLPTVYRSTAVVQLLPSPLGDQQASGLEFNPRTILSFEAYRSIALDNAVLDRTLAALEETGLRRGELKRSLELRRLSGPDNPNQIAPLAVEHIVTGEQPERVAQIAAAWSQASLEAVRNAMTLSIDSMAATTRESLQRRQLAVEESEAAWQAFQARDDRDAIKLLLDDVNNRLAQTDSRHDTLERLIAVGSARQAFLRDQLAATEPGTPVEIGGQLASMVETGLLSPEAAAQLRVLLAQAPERAQEMEQDLLLLLLRADLQEETTQLVAYIAEQDVIQDRMTALESQAESLRGRLAELNRSAAELERNMLTARESLTIVADIAPIIDYAGELVATSASLLSGPVPSSSAFGGGRVFNAVVTFLLVGSLAVLFVFLREAVRDPDGDPPRSAPAGGRPPPGQGGTQQETP